MISPSFSRSMGESLERPSSQGRKEAAASPEAYKALLVEELEKNETLLRAVTELASEALAPNDPLTSRVRLLCVQAQAAAVEARQAFVRYRENLLN